MSFDQVIIAYIPKFEFDIKHSKLDEELARIKGTILYIEYSL